MAAKKKARPPVDIVRTMDMDTAIDGILTNGVTPASLDMFRALLTEATREYRKQFDDITDGRALILAERFINEAPVDLLDDESWDIQKEAEMYAAYLRLHREDLSRTFHHRIESLAINCASGGNTIDVLMVLIEMRRKELIAHMNSSDLRPRVSGALQERLLEYVLDASDVYEMASDSSAMLALLCAHTDRALALAGTSFDTNKFVASMVHRYGPLIGRYRAIYAAMLFPRGTQNTDQHTIMTQIVTKCMNGEIEIEDDDAAIVGERSF